MIRICSPAPCRSSHHPGISNPHPIRLRVADLNHIGWNWLARRASNPRLPLCKSGTLPAELRASGVWSAPADLNRALPVMSRPLSPGELWAVMVSSAGVEPADDAELKAAAYANSATRTLPFESPTAFTCTAGRAAPTKANTRRVTDIAPMSAQAWCPDLNAVALTRYICCLHNALLPQWLLVPAPGVEPGNSEF